MSLEKEKEKQGANQEDEDEENLNKAVSTNSHHIIDCLNSYEALHIASKSKAASSTKLKSKSQTTSNLMGLYKTPQKASSNRNDHDENGVEVEDEEGDIIFIGEINISQIKSPVISLSSFKCAYCSNLFISKESMYEHFKTTHYIRARQFN